MYRSRKTSLALVGLFLWATACSTYSHIEPSEVADHWHVRVTTTDGVRQNVKGPRIESDRIVGQNTQPIPLDQVAELEAIGTNEVSTIFAVLGIALGAVVVWGLAECAGNDEALC